MTLALAWGKWVPETASDRKVVLGQNALIPAVVVVAVCGGVASAAFWMSSISHNINAVDEKVTAIDARTIAMEEVTRSNLSKDTFERWVTSFREQNPELKIPELIR